MTKPTRRLVATPHVVELPNPASSTVDRVALHVIVDGEYRAVRLHRETFRMEDYEWVFTGVYAMNGVQLIMESSVLEQLETMARNALCDPFGSLIERMQVRVYMGIFGWITAAFELRQLQYEIKCWRDDDGKVW